MVEEAKQRVLVRNLEAVRIQKLVDGRKRQIEHVSHFTVVKVPILRMPVIVLVHLAIQVQSVE